jgi:hypothetical protein
MEIEQICEMFPTKNEQRLAQRVLEIIINHSNVSVYEISEIMFPNKSTSARMSDCCGLNQVLTDLHALGIIVCSQDCFGPNSVSGKALSLLCALHTAKRNNQTVESETPKYIALLCGFCGEIIGTRGSSKSATCKKCGHKNSLQNTCEVILKTSDWVKLQSTIKQNKIERHSSNKIPPFSPDIKQK